MCVCKIEVNVENQLVVGKKLVQVSFFQLLLKSRVVNRGHGRGEGGGRFCSS